MAEIDLEADKVKYQAELDSYIRALQELDGRRQQLMQAIAERRGILIYIRSKDKMEVVLP